MLGVTSCWNWDGYIDDVLLECRLIPATLGRQPWVASCRKNIDTLINVFISDQENVMDRLKTRCTADSL